MPRRSVALRGALLKMHLLPNKPCHAALVNDSSSSNMHYDKRSMEWQVQQGKNRRIKGLLSMGAPHNRQGSARVHLIQTLWLKRGQLRFQDDETLRDSAPGLPSLLDTCASKSKRFTTTLV